MFLFLPKSGCWGTDCSHEPPTALQHKEVSRGGSKGSSKPPSLQRTVRAQRRRRGGVQRRLSTACGVRLWRRLGAASGSRLASAATAMFEQSGCLAVPAGLGRPGQAEFSACRQHATASEFSRLHHSSNLAVLQLWLTLCYSCALLRCCWLQYYSIQ